MSATEAIALALQWSSKYQILNMLIPMVVTVISLSIFGYKINKLVKNSLGPDMEPVLLNLQAALKKNTTKTIDDSLNNFHTKMSGDTKTELNEALGSFRVELRKLIDSEHQVVKAKLTSDARDFEVSVERQTQKLARAHLQTPQSQSIRPERESRGSPNYASEQAEYEKNWGELQEMWTDVWSWTRETLDYAKEHDRRGVVLGRLRNVALTSPVDVIVMLFNYGWYGDKSSDLALDMADMFNRHRTKILPVDGSAIRLFRKHYNAWLKEPD